MNREDYILTIVAPYKRSTFTVHTLEKIALSHKRPRKLFLGLPKPAFVAMVLVMLLVVPSATYAITRWISIRSEGVSPSGRSQYSVDAAGDCAANSTKLKYFELRKDTPIDDPAEIEKIIRAACEQEVLQEFVSTHYPSNALTRSLKAGDVSIMYTYSIPAELQSHTPTKATLNLDGHMTHTYQTPRDKTLAYFDIANQKSIPAIKDDATVVAVLRQDVVTQADSSGITAQEYVVALVRLSLPRDYYQDKQRYIMQLDPCDGNADELCPNGSAVDVYPRGDAEARVSPYNTQSPETSQRKRISGTVTDLTDSTLTIRSRVLQNSYTVSLTEPGFKQWNETYSQPYAPADVVLSVGDEVKIEYVQPKTQPSRSISGDQILQIFLLMDGRNFKTETPEKYNTGL